MIYAQIWISVQTILNVLFLTTKKWWAPLWCIYNELCWVTYVLYSQQFGLLLMNVFLIMVYIRMYIKWRKDDVDDN